MAEISKREILKFMLGIIKDEVKKTAETFVEQTLYSEPYDFSQVVPYTGGDHRQIRVIGSIVTIY